jgi:hypothetical protein
MSDNHRIRSKRSGHGIAAFWPGLRTPAWTL